jgi:hypothetical protein
MMGRQNNEQGPLFYEFRLDKAVPDDHLVRKIDADLISPTPPVCLARMLERRKH